MSFGFAIQQSYWNILHPERPVVLYTSYENLQFAIETIWDVGRLFCFVNSKK